MDTIKPLSLVIAINTMQHKTTTNWNMWYTLLLLALVVQIGVYYLFTIYYR